MNSAPARQSHLDAFGAGVLTLLCALWGFQQVTIKVAAAGISPAMQAGLRSLLAVLLLVLWMRARRIRLLEADGTLLPGAVTGILFAGEFVLLFWGLTFTSASRAIIFLYMAPFVVAAGVHFLVPSERLNALQIGGMVLAFTGIVVIFARGGAAGGDMLWLGDLMAFGAGVLWGITTLVIRTTRLVTIAPSRVLFYQLAVSALLLPVASIALAEPGVFNLTPLIIACVVFQGAVVAFASYLAWFWLIARYPVPKLSGYTFLAPVLGVISGIVFLDEPLTISLVIGAALVGTGIHLVNRRMPLIRR